VERSIKQYSAGPLSSLSKNNQTIRSFCQIACHPVTKAANAKREGQTISYKPDKIDSYCMYLIQFIFPILYVFALEIFYTHSNTRVRSYLFISHCKHKRAKDECCICARVECNTEPLLSTLIN
jgi:hypothetical protein